MIRDITIGQYYRADSPIHDLDPRVKIIGTLGYVLSLFLFRSLIGFGFVFLFFGLVLRSSKVPFSFLIRGLKPILSMLIITAMLNLFWTPGHTLWHFKVLCITYEGLQKSIFMACRLILLILGSSLLTLTTTPNQLTDGLENLLKPLEKVKVPVHEIAMMMAIALRFIPILIEETNKIMKAQEARGADFESGNVFHRLKNMIPILVPLFASALRRATELANAMDARCYHGGEERTKMRPLVYRHKDILAYVMLAVYFCFAIMLCLFLRARA